MYTSDLKNKSEVQNWQELAVLREKGPFISYVKC